MIQFVSLSLGCFIHECKELKIRVRYGRREGPEQRASGHPLGGIRFRQPPRTE